MEDIQPNLKQSDSIATKTSLIISDGQLKLTIVAITIEIDWWIPSAINSHSTPRDN